MAGHSLLWPLVRVSHCAKRFLSHFSYQPIERGPSSQASLLTRPLIKLHIIWKKGGIPVSSGISDYNRRLTILNPSLSDSGYYECEAVLRSSSVPSVVRGAYLSVLGKKKNLCLVSLPKATTHQLGNHIRFSCCRGLLRSSAAQSISLTIECRFSIYDVTLVIP